MSRVDEALRRASAMDDSLDVETVEVRASIDATTLDRYEPESRLDVEKRFDLEKPSRQLDPRPAEPRAVEPRAAEPLVIVRPAPVVVVQRPDKPVPRLEIPEAQASRLVVSPHVPPFVVEQYRRLAAVLSDLQVQRGVKTVMVSSAAPREGKTLTITNLALTLSESYQRRVLLVDADLRRPSIHEVLGIKNGAGLADVVRNRTTELPAVQMTKYLSVLTAGRVDATLLAQLASDSMKNAIADAARQFDWVLVDTPPVGLLPDAQLVARICEAVLFVIGAGVSPYEFVQRSIATLGTDSIVGVVLNRMDESNVPHGDYYYRNHYPLIR